MTSYVFIALTILLTVYGQLVLKWQVSKRPEATLAGMNPEAIVSLLLNPWVISGFVAAFGASLCWMAAISKLPLSKAYPFMALSFPTVGALAVWIFGEQFGTNKIIGTALIILGVIVLARAPA